MTHAKELEDLRQMLAFYMGEGEKQSHQVEKDYCALARIPPEDRTKEQNERLAELAKVLMRAAEASQMAFLRELGDFLHAEKCKTRFSLCLDCDLKNRCKRYSNHLKEPK